MTSSILIVDDESSIRDMLRMALESNGFNVDEASNAKLAQEKINQNTPDLLLLDWMMPGTSGVELVRRLRKEDSTRQLPIIMLTAKDGDEHSIQALDTGADDFITKPFSPKALIARVKAMLRRLDGSSDDFQQEQKIVSGDITIDMVSHKATVSDQTLELSPTEFRLLAFFSSHSGRVFSRNQLLNQVWGESVYVEDRTVDVHIRRLRKILERYGVDQYIQTVRGVGYRFDPAEA
ncbi:MAG: phosphate regulon transcriptional regulator PhoB [Arenicella sp.]